MIILSRIKSWFLQLLEKVSNSLVMVSIRQGLTLMIPVVMAGAFAMFLNNLPVRPYQEFMFKLFGSGWKSLGVYIQRGTFGVMAAGMLLSISYSMARNSVRGRRYEVNPMITAVVSMASFFAIVSVSDSFMSLNWIGPLGVFISIVTACTSSALFLLLSSMGWMRIRMYSNSSDVNLVQAMSALLPAFATVSVFALLHVILASCGIEDLNEAIHTGLKGMFTGMSSSLLTAVIFISVVHIFWFFGVHGSNVLEPLTQSLFVPALEVNRNLVSQGLPPSEIFTKQFFDVFVLLGGSGATLCLITALLFGVRRSNTRQIAAISILPGIINVNEIVVFGVPVVLNLYLFVPFVILPGILTLVTYAAMSLGLVHMTVEQVEWTTPLIIGGYTSTGSVSGALLQLFNFFIGVVVYWPFVSMYERHLSRGQAELVNNLLEEVHSLDEKKNQILLNRMDDTGNVSRMLATDMVHDLYNGRISLVYQPQVNSSGRMVGMEALLRWDHGKFGPIPPPVTIAIAEETPFIHELGLWIIKTSCSRLKEWHGEGLDEITLSINISPYQLDDPAFPGKIRSVIDETGICSSCIELEITEQTALGGVERLRRLNELKRTGLRLAMDDFGMGHSSLMYLKELNLDTIKLDGALIQEVLFNERCGEIISSIVQLGKSMGISIIAEFVNTEEQQAELMRLGCFIYQGYLYSPPLAEGEVARYYFSLKEGSVLRG